MQVITKRDRLLTLKLGVSEHNLPNPNKFGELTVQAEESSGSKAIMEMIFRCSDLEIKDLLTKSVSLRSYVFRSSVPFSLVHICDCCLAMPIFFFSCHISPF